MDHCILPVMGDLRVAMTQCPTMAPIKEALGEWVDVVSVDTRELGEPLGGHHPACTTTHQ